MKQVSNTNRERILAGILALLGLGSLVWAWTAVPLFRIQPGEVLLAVSFAGAIILAESHLVHILRGTKVSLINVPILLSAALLPAPLAVSATGVGLLIANLRARTELGLLPRDIIITIARWILLVFLGNQIIHLTLPGVPSAALRDGLLIACVLTFLAADFLLVSFSQSFIFGEPIFLVMKALVKESLVLEIVQYLIAILGTIAAYESIWSLILLPIPIVITYIAFKNLKETRIETIQLLEDMADTVDLRDRYTGGHSKRVAELVRQILVQLDVSGPEAKLIVVAARLHDIGKIGIPDSVLQKPGKLLPEEMAVMQTHSEKGGNLISKYKDFCRGAKMILHHHERWDGNGYPTGLKAHEIPFGARVIAVADGFDAMTSERPYRKALSTKMALQVLLNEQGKQWDPIIVNACIQVVSRQVPDESNMPNATVQTGVPQTLSKETVFS